MSNDYLIPQFIIDFLQNSKSAKNPQRLASTLLTKNSTPEIKIWFKENDVNASYIWKFFVSQGKTQFYYKTCAVCGKRIKLETLVGFPDAKYCSSKCRANSKDVKEKKKQTNLEKYGVEHPAQSKDIREKQKQTCLKKYGVENPFQSKWVQEKLKETNCKKYGVENPSQSNDIKEKKRQTFLEKYGVKNPSQNKEIHEKQFKTQRANHWETFYSLLKEKDIIPLFGKEYYINDIGRKFKCLNCGEKFESEGTCNYKKEHKNKDGSYTTLLIQNIFCPYCLKIRYSKKEKDVLKYVKSIYNGAIQENAKGLFKHGNMELDIYLPSLNLAIEFDGDYWHSTDEAKERDERKNQLCEEKGIRLLRIKESDWDNNQEIVKNQIKEFVCAVKF